MTIKNLESYQEFEIALKNLINDIDSDIIKIDCKKTSKNINITINKEEKYNINIKL
jgi:hypothetical protein